MNEPPETPVRPERKATIRIGQHGLNAISIFVILCIFIPLMFVGYHGVMTFKSKRDITIAKSNLHGLYLALYHYSLDWDGKLPPAEGWTDTAEGYLPSANGVPGGKLSYLQGPGDGDTVRYEYNEAAAGYNMQDERGRTMEPNQLVLLIEHLGAPRNAHVRIPKQDKTAGTLEALYKLLDFPHYKDDPDNATTVILYASGRVDDETRRDLRPQ